MLLKSNLISLITKNKRYLKKQLRKRFLIKLIMTNKKLFKKKNKVQQLSKNLNLYQI
jgi:hypothetical protein